MLMLIDVKDGYSPLLMRKGITAQQKEEEEEDEEFMDPTPLQDDSSVL